MTNKERMLATLHHQQADKVPFDIDFTIPARQKMADYYRDNSFQDRLERYIVNLSTDLPNGWKEVSPHVWEDEFGVRWDRSIDRDIGVVSNRVITPENLDDYQFPGGSDRLRTVGFLTEIQNHSDKFVVAGMGFSLFERAWTLVGMENLLMFMVTEPLFVHKLLDRILQYNLQVIDQACSFQIDAVRFGDDWGMQKGLIMGPDLWREFIKPRIRQMYQRVKENRKFVMVHSCGKVDSIFPDLIECGLDVFNPFQPEVMDVFEMKRVYGKDLSFHGGISTQRLLPHGTPDQVMSEVRRLLDEIGRDGGYIAAPAHAIPGDARPENVDAMIEVLHNQ